MTAIQRIVPYLIYADAPAAIEFLRRAFGFEERLRVPMPDGRVGHAEVGQGDHTIMLASVYPELGFSSPRDLPAQPGQVFCYVNDIDEHHDRARAAGATIIEQPKDDGHGGRSYRAVDLEGHRWIFSATGSRKE